MPGSNLADRRAETQDHPVLFQQFFKSGSRTYAAQVKQASNGKPFLVLTEGKRDPKTNDVKKSKLFVFCEDLTEFFRLLQETATFLRPLRQQMKDGVPAASLATPPAPAKPALQPAPIAMKPPMPRPTAAVTNGKGNNGSGKPITPPRQAVQPPAIAMKPPAPRPMNAPSNGNGKAIDKPLTPPARAVAVVRAMPPRPAPARPMSRPVAAGRPSAASRESAKKTGRAR